MASPYRLILIPNERVVFRELSIRFDYSSTTERFELYEITVEGEVRSQMPFRGVKARI